jgi:hypothetical protein
MKLNNNNRTNIIAAELKEGLQWMLVHVHLSGVKFSPPFTIQVASLLI